MLRRLLQLFIGLTLYGVSTAMFVRADLGADPWNVFHLGVANLLSMNIGVVIIAVGVLVLLAWIPLRQRPGFGTLSNVIMIGLAADAALLVIPGFESLLARCGLLVSAVILNALATSLYIGAGFGAGLRFCVGLAVALFLQRGGAGFVALQHLLQDVGLALRALVVVAGDGAGRAGAHRHGLALVQVAVLVAQRAGALDGTGQLGAGQLLDRLGAALLEQLQLGGVEQGACLGEGVGHGAGTPCNAMTNQTTALVWTTRKARQLP